MPETDRIDEAITTYLSIYTKISKNENFSNLDKQELNLVTSQIIELYIYLSKKQLEDKVVSTTDSSNNKDNSSSEETDNKKIKTKNLILFIFNIVPFVVILIYIFALSVPRIFPEPMETPNPEITSYPSPSPQVTETP